MSLCYYCAANYIETKQTMLVDCGIETENIEKPKPQLQPSWTHCAAAKLQRKNWKVP